MINEEKIHTNPIYKYSLFNNCQINIPIHYYFPVIHRKCCKTLSLKLLESLSFIFLVLSLYIRGLYIRYKKDFVKIVIKYMLDRYVILTIENYWF